MKTYALILAAGKGTRMKSELPKCAYPILKKPMIEYIIENIEKSEIEEIVVVVGYKKEVFYDMLSSRVKFTVQAEQLGTGHAVLSAQNALLGEKSQVFIFPGDMPLISSELINQALSAHSEMGNDLTIISAINSSPAGYGRIVRNKYGNITSIVEDIDCNEMQKEIKEINTGAYIVNTKHLFRELKNVTLNKRKGEYYLTDIVALMHQKYKVGSYALENSEEVMGINDLYQISLAEKYLRLEINKKLMLSGVSIVNPETITIGHNVVVEPGATVYPNTTITGHSLISCGAIIGPNTEIHESIIHAGAKISHSLVYDSEIFENTTVGPFAHLREHAIIGANNRIGNFVEVKKSQTGTNTKASHLIYIGDALVGNDVNFGCGSVTVNYDGVKKNQTKIGNDVFVGCNVNLIAPISIEDNVFIAAGSTVTKDIPKGAFAIARNRQINKEDYAKNLIHPKPPQNI